MEKQVQETLESLSSVEKKLIHCLELGNIEQIKEKSNIDHASINKAIQMLASKKIITLESKIKKFVSLDVNGIEYKKRGLPERRLLDVLLKKSVKLEDAKQEVNLSNNELTIALGILKKKNLIKIEKNQISCLATKEEAMKRFAEERFLDSLPLPLEKLNEEEKAIFESLRLRKNIVFIEEEKTNKFEITSLGQEIISNIDKAEDSIEQLSPDIIKTEKWKMKKFRPYDIKVKTPIIYGGKRQPYLKFLEQVKLELISLGFEESSGPVVESNFFNCDALFMPQDHPARGIHDLYFTNEKAELKKYKNILKNVAKTHENGWKTGSDGWHYRFSLEETSKLLLRSQGTAVSARILASKCKIPGKYFSIARVFRPDIIDSSHLPEFNQLEGIVIDKSVDFRHLLGLLKLFAEKIAKTKNIKLVPSYFPFTEPSVELQAFFNGKWLELGGAGILRPEVTIPLGLDKETRVLAWGLGIDRLFMIKENINDIRELFSQDLNFLRGK